MITRIFRATVHDGMQVEFEARFKSISEPLVAAQEGLISVSIGRPIITNPTEFVMISVWENLEVMKKFAGEDWDQAHIPEGMEKYFDEFWMHHYENIEL